MPDESIGRREGRLEEQAGGGAARAGRRVLRALHLCLLGACLLTAASCGEDPGGHNGVCEPDCEGLECGPDPVCGVSCGPCDDGERCDGGACCRPDCEDRVCGSDGCGGRCTPGCEHESWCLEERGRCMDEMVLVPAGPFMMGCNEDVDDQCQEREYPRHEVNVPEFEIDRYPVTVPPPMGAPGRTSLEATTGCCGEAASPTMRARYERRLEPMEARYTSTPGASASAAAGRPDARDYGLSIESAAALALEARGAGSGPRISRATPGLPARCVWELHGPARGT